MVADGSWGFGNQLEGSKKWQKQQQLDIREMRSVILMLFWVSVPYSLYFPSLHSSPLPGPIQTNGYRGVLSLFCSCRGYSPHTCTLQYAPPLNKVQAVMVRFEIFSFFLFFNEGSGMYLPPSSPTYQFLKYVEVCLVISAFTPSQHFLVCDGMFAYFKVILQV